MNEWVIAPTQRAAAFLIGSGVLRPCSSAKMEKAKLILALAHRREISAAQKLQITRLDNYG
jgi:hypothetical protein